MVWAIGGQDCRFDFRECRELAQPNLKGYLVKFVVAQMKHETHTFVPQTVALRDFNISGGDVPLAGDEAIESRRGGNNAAAAFIDLAEGIGADYEVPVMGEAVPFGPTEDSAFEYMSGRIVEAVKRGCDAVLLDLHGSMVTESLDDGEGELLRRIRDVAPDIPIAVALDFHCTVTTAMIDHATVITIYRTTPHVDMYETGKRAANTLLGLLQGKNRPVLVAKRLPLMASLEQMGQETAPMKDVIDLLSEMEAKDDAILNASLSGGHPFSDIPPGGMTAVIVADGQRQAAAAAAEKALELAWEKRDGFIYSVEPIIDSLKFAKGLAEGPIIMADSGDIPSSGGYGTDMTVLKQVMALGFEDVAVGSIYDPESVAQMAAAGVGAEVTLNLGGKMCVPLLKYKGESLRISGTVRTLVDGVFEITGPMLTGMKLAIGRMAVLSSGSVDILITEQRTEAFDLSFFKHVGIDPLEKKYSLIKSRQHFRAAFEPIAKHVVRVSGPGITNPDFSGFPYKHIVRPIFPLDKDTPFQLDDLGCRDTRL